MCNSVITKQTYPNMMCGNFGCRQTSAWNIGKPDSPPHMWHNLCDEGARNMILTLPDELLPAVEQLVLKHITEGTPWGQALMDKIIAVLPGEEDAGAVQHEEPGAEDPAPGGEPVSAPEQSVPAELKLLTEEVITDDYARCICGKEFHGDTAKANLGRHKAKCEVVKAKAAAPNA